MHGAGVSDCNVSGEQQCVRHDSQHDGGVRVCQFPVYQQFVLCHARVHQHSDPVPATAVPAERDLLELIERNAGALLLRCAELGFASLHRLVRSLYDSNLREQCVQLVVGIMLVGSERAGLFAAKSVFQRFVPSR